MNVINEYVGLLGRKFYIIIGSDSNKSVEWFLKMFCILINFVSVGKFVSYFFYLFKFSFWLFFRVREIIM